MIWKESANAQGAVENGNTISRSYSLAASAPEIPPYTCDTSFPVDTSIGGIATNIPSTSCATTAIKVLYSVRAVSLSPPSSYYSPGASITCTAMGHPSPTFKWQESQSDGSWVDVHDGGQFMRNEVFSNQFRCVAMNVVKDINYNSTSSEFKINNTDELTSTPVGSSVEADRPSFGVGIGIGLLTAIVLSAVVFVILIKRGYIEFHRRPGNTPRDGVVQRTEQEMMHPSTHGTGDPQDSTYASLGENRDANVYQSIEQSQKSKEKKKSRP